MKHLLLLLALSAPLCAAPDQAKVYEGLMSDSELYSGEGIVGLSTYGGDAAKAKAAARERARAALAEGIKVRVTSQVTDVMTQDGEKTEARSVSIADLELENIAYRSFDDFPKPGQLTVVATLSKTEYERQLAGRRANRYRPHWGFGVAATFNTLFSVFDFLAAENKKQASGIPLQAGGNISSGGGSADSTFGFGLQFRFKEWSLMFEQAMVGAVHNYPYDAATGTYRSDNTNFEYLGLEAGWDFVPWALRFQPYLPLRLRGHHAALGDYGAWLFDASAGLGLRYWASESFYFDASGRYIPSLGKSPLMKAGKPFAVNPTQNAEIDLSGAQWQLNLTWTGF